MFLPKRWLLYWPLSAHEAVGWFGCSLCLAVQWNNKIKEENFHIFSLNFPRKLLDFSDKNRLIHSRHCVSQLMVNANKRVFQQLFSSLQELRRCKFHTNRRSFSKPELSKISRKISLITGAQIFKQAWVYNKLQQ